MMANHYITPRQISKMREQGCKNSDIISEFCHSPDVSPVLKSKMVIKIFGLAQSFKVGDDVVSELYEKALSNNPILAFFGVYYLLANVLFGADEVNKTNCLTQFQKHLADFITTLCQHETANAQ